MQNLEDITKELERPRPLSVIMAEHVQALRVWAKQRTVMANKQVLRTEY